MRSTLCVLLLVAAGAVCTLSPARAEPKSERTVNCVYPGETLGGAIGDLATQLGYAFVPGELEDSYELGELIWVHARDVSLDAACVMISQSGGVGVHVDEANRRVTVTAEAGVTDASRVRAFRVDALCAAHKEYEASYGFLEQDIDSAEVYRASATDELIETIDAILQLAGASASAVGKRLIYTRPAAELDRIAELLRLLEGHGESEALRLDREHRAKLSAHRSDFRSDEVLMSAVLWQLFKDYEAPVYIDHALMDAVDLESQTTEVALTREKTHYDALLALAREQEFAIDSRNGALRLHADSFEGASGYRVFDVSALLAELEKEYADLRTGDAADGFSGDLRSEGGAMVIVDALAVQLENAGYSPLVCSFGARVVVVGGVEIVGHAAEVLTAIGWTEEKK